MSLAIVSGYAEGISFLQLKWLDTSMHVIQSVMRTNVKLAMLALYLKERWLVLMERLSTEALEAIEKRAGDCIKCDACAVIPYTCETPVKQEEIQFVAREFLKYIHGGTYDESKFNR